MNDTWERILVVIWFDLSWSETWVTSKYKESNELLWQIDDTSSDEWCRRCDLWECFKNPGRDLREWAPMLIRELQEFNKLFAQMEILQQQLTQSCPETRWFVKMFYKSATWVLPNLGFETVQISFYWQGHRKMIRQLVGSQGMSSCVDPRIVRVQ